MAAKKCPKCGCECPVASSSCKSCFHVFKTRKGSTGAVSGSSNPDEKGDATYEAPETATVDMKNNEAGSRRYTGRVTRAKPNFYDSLHVEEQMKQRKLLQRQQLKQTKAESKGADSEEPSGKASSTSDKNLDDGVRKKRGRPASNRIGINPRVGSSQLINSKKDPSEEKVEAANPEDYDEMPVITPEKALQFNVVLNEINRKLVAANWSAK